MKQIKLKCQEVEDQRKELERQLVLNAYNQDQLLSHIRSLKNINKETSNRKDAAIEQLKEEKSALEVFKEAMDKEFNELNDKYN